MSAGQEPIAFYTHLRDGLGRDIVVRQKFSEGYPTDEFSIDNIRLEDLQSWADQLIALPPEIYKHVEKLSRSLERFLIWEKEHR